MCVCVGVGVGVCVKPLVNGEFVTRTTEVEQNYTSYLLQNYTSYYRMCLFKAPSHARVRCSYYRSIPLTTELTSHCQIIHLTIELLYTSYYRTIHLTIDLYLLL